MKPVDLERGGRARPVRFVLPDGVEVVVPPVTLDQCVECLLLDPAPGAPETPLEEQRRLKRQAAILLGPQHAGLTGKLDKWQIIQVVGALYISGAGMDAEGFARWQLEQRRNGYQLDTLVMITRLDDLSIDLASELKRLPAEIGAQPLADLSRLQESLAEKRRELSKWEAGLHDKRLV